jgi:hypothetical protein
MSSRLPTGARAATGLPACCLADRIRLLRAPTTGDRPGGVRALPAERAEDQAGDVAVSGVGRVDAVAADESLAGPRQPASGEGIHEHGMDGLRLPPEHRPQPELAGRIPGRIAVIVDTPEPGEDVPSCLSRHPDDIRQCAIPKATATANRLRAVERRATRATGDALIDLTRRICPSWPCQVVGDGIIKFRDIRHLTATCSRSMAGGLDRALALVLEPGPSIEPSPSPSGANLGPSSVQGPGPTPAAR